MATKSSHLLATIKAKLIFIAVLFVLAMVAMETFSSYSQRTLDQASAEDVLRGKQLDTLTSLDFAFLHFTLAGMDAIIDKGDGNIGTEVRNEVDTAIKHINNTLPMVQELADTAEEKRLAGTIVQAYSKLKQAIHKDLFKAIQDLAGDEVFAELDDRIDSLFEKINAALAQTKASVAEEKLEAKENLQKTIRSEERRVGKECRL